MKIKDIQESTVAGSIASVAKPLGELQTRSKPEKAPKVTKGKKYANTISEGAVKQLAYDLIHMDPKEFQEVYKRAKEFFQKPPAAVSPANPAATTTSTKTGSKVWHDTGYTDKKAAKAAQKSDEKIQEDELNEEDLIILPGMLRGKDKSFISKQHDRRDHEVEMARSDVYAAAKDAMRIFKILEARTEDEGLMGWQQSYITLAADYLNSVADSLEYEGITNESLVGKFAKWMAQKSLNDLPRTPDVDRAIANRTNRYERNINDAGLYGTGLGTGVLSQQDGANFWDKLGDKSKNKTNPEDELQPVQVTGKRIPQRIPQGKVTIEPMPNNSIRQPKFQAPQRVSPPLKPERGQNKPGLRTASLDTNTNMIEGVIAGGMSNFEESMPLSSLTSRYLDDPNHPDYKSTREPQKEKTLQDILKDEDFKALQIWAQDNSNNPLVKGMSAAGDAAFNNIRQKLGLAGKMSYEIPADVMMNKINPVIRKAMFDYLRTHLQGVTEVRRSSNPYDQYDQEEAAMALDRRRFKWDELSQELKGEEEAARRANEGPWYIRIDGKLVRDKNKDPYVFNTLSAASKAAQTMMQKDWNKGKQFSYSRTPTDAEKKLEEKKDACYTKVKSRYKVWPSAYASGALSKCRKVGASNWGNKSKK